MQEQVTSTPPPADSGSPTLAEAPPTQPRAGLGRAIAREVVETLVLFAVVMVISRLLIGNFMIEQTSAVPNYMPGDRILVDQVIYKYTGGLHRGDLVVLRAPRFAAQDLFKRIIGLPGETLEVRGGKVMVNGKVLAEPYVNPNAPSNGADRVYQLGPDEYWVMGDNRGGSTDSRVWGSGVRSDEIIGRAWLRYFPLEKFQLIHGVTYGP